jgi:membrane protein implicated in regulation of membrane protease activity
MNTEFLFYSICFGAGLLFTLVTALLGHLFGGGHDAGGADVGTGGHAEAGFDDAGMPGLSPFSPTTVCSFITAMGGFGMIFSRIEATQSVWLSAPLSILGGLIVAGSVVWLFGYVFHKTQSSSEGKIAQLVGHSATVITPIPPNGVGEIAYVQAGSRYTAPARSDAAVEIGNGRTVRINRIVGTQVFVELT